ncbi:hypothetical protein CLV84_2715 [Neolewinella xylanilytica]|uniref:HTH domain-containing protein n=1 Tax=Neolewinella xylanilytica TaxID=1514080 RepID=A0A2S6I3P1_9BACT|nr:hypothetical protein [Neolewinella xylanilytica]PPK85808.1 hypothetical protein CLV84_2715 [Neolewinella xylanilytica]
MSVLKQVERLRRMHTFIKFHRTGTPEEFAGRLGISQPGLYRLLSQMKALGAPIHFCQQRQSYAYYESVELRIDFVRVQSEQPGEATSFDGPAKVRKLVPPAVSSTAAVS